MSSATSPDFLCAVLGGHLEGLDAPSNKLRRSMDNASKESLDRQQQYKLSLLRGRPDETLLRSEPQSKTVQAAGSGKITQCNLTVTLAEEKKSELRGSKDKSARRNRGRK